MSESPALREYVSDTMAIVLWLERRKLPQKVMTIFQSVLGGSKDIRIWIPAMVLTEVGYLFEKERIEISPFDLLSFIQSTAGSFQIRPLDESIVLKAFEINDIPELHDRLIVGTALYLNCSILTNDPIIGQSRFINSIWK